MILNARNVRTIITTNEGSVFVRVEAIGTLRDAVDRGFVASWSVGTEGAKGVHLRAERLSDAVLAGVVFERADIRTDIFGKLYVNAPSRVSGRHLMTDLRRLGF